MRFCSSVGAPGFKAAASGSKKFVERNARLEEKDG
jgi:hypothetical protein